GCHLDEENGAVIYAQDGSVTNLKGGTIVGNTTNTGCGGVYYSGPGVNATVHLDGTNLIGNTACNVSDPNDGDYGGGGAIYNENGVVTMSAGRLLYNSAYRSTAIRVPDPIPGVEGTGVFTMTGGEITETNVNMYADSSGRDGVIVIKNGTFNMTGGSIEYNNAANAAVIALIDGEEDGVPYSGTFNMSGGTLRDLDNNNSYLVLVGNSSHTFIVSGNVNINAKTEHPNVYLASGATITIGGALTGQIKVTMEEPGVFTSGYSGYHPSEGNIVCFASDSSEYGIKIIDGELTLVECFDVDFDSNGGSTIESQTVLSGEYAAEPTMPTQEGFTFLYWYLEEDPDTPFDFENTPIDESITLYAKWEEA
ncbi:MAG: InlB B-repeat-containing protein, partial [Clostridia bacterium]|nr:InlB B-repeat-containing protein [Clostridia bacterium]